MPITLDGPPPMQPQGPTLAGMTGMQGGPMGAPGGGPAPGGGVTPGMGQMATLAVRAAMEVDMSLKQLAQVAPMMTPWIMQVSEQLKMQVAQAMGAGGVPAMPAGAASQFPDGTGRL